MARKLCRHYVGGGESWIPLRLQALLSHQRLRDRDRDRQPHDGTYQLDLVEPLSEQVKSPAWGRPRQEHVNPVGENQRRGLQLRRQRQQGGSKDVVAVRQDASWVVRDQDVVLY